MNILFIINFLILIFKDINNITIVRLKLLAIIRCILTFKEDCLPMIYMLLGRSKTYYW